LHVINDFDVLQLLGHEFDYVYPPSIQTRGGILITWSRSSWSVSSVTTGTYAITTKVRHINGGQDWWITSVYDPTVDTEKPNFLTELREIKDSKSGPWLVCGDFNIIYSAEDKSNDKLDP
jgi:exonuclease III